MLKQLQKWNLIMNIIYEDSKNVKIIKIFQPEVGLLALKVRRLRYLARPRLLGLYILIWTPSDPLPVGIFWWFLHFWNPYTWYSPQDFIFGVIWTLLFLGFISKPRKLRRLRCKAKRARKFSKKILVNAFDPNNSKMPRLNRIFHFGRISHFWDTLKHFIPLTMISVEPNISYSIQLIWK